MQATGGAEIYLIYEFHVECAEPCHVMNGALLAVEYDTFAVHNKVTI